MDQPTSFSRAERIEAERKLLSVLCQRTLDEHTCSTILLRLKEHRFAEPDFEVICRALAATPAADPADIREDLARAVTRLGFPDVDFDALFSATPPASTEVAELLQRL